MTREAFDAEIKDNIHSSCVLWGVGEFYFVYGDYQASSTIKRREVHLYFYNEALKQKHSSPDYLFYHQVVPGKSLAINENTFFFDGFAWGYILTLRDNWRSPVYEQFGNDIQQRLADFYNPQTSIQKKGLAKIRLGSPGDFVLVSEEGTEIKVHKSVMIALWPFFAKMMQSNMKEATDNELELPMPKAVLDEIVGYLYGHYIYPPFDVAAQLVVFAQMYDLPELLDMAIKKVKSVNMKIGQAILLWQKSFEAGNDELKVYAASKLHKAMPNMSNFNEQIEGLEKDQLISLFQDLCIAMAKKD